MNPEIEQLKAQVAELMAWKAEREYQQISHPIDDASLSTITERFVGLIGVSTSNSSLTQVYTDSNGDTVTAPKAYAGRLTIQYKNSNYAVPFL